MKLNLPRGMRDLFDEDANNIDYIREKFYELISCYNFQLIEPSPLELLSVLEAKSGSSIVNEVYGFEDKGGRNIALRYDLTIGITRFAMSRRDLRLPLKLASFGEVWRYDEPQAGRYRHFHQWDIEIYDNFNQDVDAEIIEFVSNFFDKLGLDIVIEISDRRILEEYVHNNFGIDNENTLNDIFRAIDKVSKKSIAQVCSEYKDLFDEKMLKDLLEVSSFKGNISDLKSNKKLNKIKSITYLKELFLSLKNRHIKNVIINLGIVRGLDYYSGMVFEVFDTTGKNKNGYSYKSSPLQSSSNISSSLVGGGRYDKLTSAFGRSDIGAAGAAGGVERIILALQNSKKFQIKKKILVYVANSNISIRNQTISISSSLRKKGYTVDYDILDRSLKKQLYDASSKKASFTILVAPEEFAKKTVIVRNMIDGKETIVNIENIEEKLDELSTLQLNSTS